MDRFKKYSPYEKWILNTFGGPRPLDGLLFAVKNLRLKAEQTKLPIKLSLIANCRGINSAPLYRRIEYDGCLIILNKELRIVLNRPSGRAIQKDSRNLGHYRFIYAHELVHSLVYDLSQKPPVRIAPEPLKQEEEYLCNRVARELLLPQDLLVQEVSEIKKLDAPSLVTLSNKARVSIHVSVLQLCDSNILPLKLGEFMLLSKAKAGTGGRGLVKPRCIACLWFNENKRYQRLIPPNKGLDCIKVDKVQSEDWSLIRYHRKMCPRIYTASKNVEEEIILPSGIKAKFTGKHERIEQSGYVWTTGFLVRKSTI